MGAPWFEDTGDSALMKETQEKLPEIDPTSVFTATGPAVGVAVHRASTRQCSAAQHACSTPSAFTSPPLTEP